ncbi:hypothetical protein [Micromonospora sp. CA-248212]|uniref:hypothetical protein n=1 Tax=Micromonospora sp. CA-248212 TaxID=3239961 RepID=UPI003D8D55C0
MQVFLVTATASDRPVVRQLLRRLDISTVEDLPADRLRVDGLTETLQPCDAVVAVPFGAGMSSLARVIGAAFRLGKPVIVFIPDGADPGRLPFSLRGGPTVGLGGEPDDVAKRVLEAIEQVQLVAGKQARGARSGLSAGPLTDEDLMPAVLAAAGVVAADVTRLAGRTESPAFVAPYDAWSFPDNVVDRYGTLRFTVDDLAHALFVTGRAPGDRMRYGAASIWEWLHRASLVPAYVRRHHTGRLVRSRLAMELDRSELVAFSYALGQAMTALFCRNALSVTHLMHVDRYASHYGMSFGNTRERADLFGPASAGWVVAEAKGRSRAMESTLRTKLRQQKRSIASIGGDRPWLALGCVAAFPKDDVGMRIHAVDPVEDGPEPVEIPAGLDDYMLAYYAPFVLAIDAGEPVVRNDRTIAARFASMGVTVCMWSDIYMRVHQAAAGGVDRLYQDVQLMLDEGLSQPLALLADGTTVETAWRAVVSASDWEV